MVCKKCTTFDESLDWNVIMITRAKCFGRFFTISEIKKSRTLLVGKLKVVRNSVRTNEMQRLLLMSGLIGTV